MNMVYDLPRSFDWFDGERDREELAVEAGDMVFARAGAGDLVLTLLGSSPRVVVAAGEAVERHLMELKLAAVKALAPAEYLEFLGVKRSHHRQELYQRIRWLLSPEADAFWQESFSRIERGLISRGDLECAMGGARRFIAVAVGGARVDAFLELDSVDAQREALESDWRGFLWRRFADRVLASAWPGMTRGRLEEVMVQGPARDNWALQWLLAGEFRTARPFVLREPTFALLKERANCVIVSPEPVGRVLAAMPDGSVDAFAMGEGDVTSDWVGAMARAGRPGARAAVRGDVEWIGDFIERGGGGAERGLSAAPLRAATLLVAPANQPT